MNNERNLTCILGPTGIGKSEFAIALAQKTNAQIISADAYQVYTGMDIGTAKINPKDQQNVVHHLIDIKHPNEPYSVHDFLQRSDSIIQQCKTTQTPLIICGGTGLFLRAFLYQYQFPQVQFDPHLREQLTQEYQQDSGHKLWKELNEIDTVSANKIHPNNKHHLIRALELARSTKKKPSEIKHQSNIRSDVQIIGLTAEKSQLIDRINLRVDKMIEQGLVNEVKLLLDKGYSANLQSLKSIGYKEVISYLNDDIGHDEMIHLIKLNTKRFSKQQMTWFKKFENVNWQTRL
jgi:tRNA dimethylallyltransferase